MSINRSNFPYIITLKLPSENSLELRINFPLHHKDSTERLGGGGERKGMQGNVR